ncbi:cation diffusion facilitator family transporter [Aneurinibacillus terranovensis]|uniref:cation diffusion facilitator family transporter n=1 Tax=Aneurinibacillus terranovensis TaxID=278991 RepID=UPI0004031D88|nr:cation diffusion facilitator family transporter [Aneurinibacillus terranovensis]
MGADKKASLVAGWISLISNIFLTIIKIWVGVLFNSQVLVADGVHNAADVAASIASLGSMRISGRPADEDHPYGHGKAEVIASGIVAVILALAAVMIAYKSIETLFKPAVTESILALVAAFISLAWKQALYMYTFRVGKKVRSKGLLATAYDHLADVYASLAAVLGIGIALVGNYLYIPFTSYGDPIAGIIVAFFIIKLAMNMGKESIDILMEGIISEEKMAEFAALVRDIPQVKRIDRLRAREHGHYVLVDVRVSVPGNLTIQEGHDVSRQIKYKIMEADKDVQEVLIHLNPWYDEDAE